jgi:transcriptional regulator with XRE-family HTH domain
VGNSPRSGRDRAAGAGDYAQTMRNAKALGEMLRRQRLSLEPTETGIVVAGRRQLTGLRREEVARLGGVSVSWYTWLEQGRDIRPSLEVLKALADALRMDPRQRRHLHALAGFSGADLTSQPMQVEAETAAMLRSLRVPAHVINARFDILAWNRRSAELVTDFDAVPRARRNLLRLTFQSDLLRERYADFGSHARHLVATFRSAAHLRPADESFTSLQRELHDASVYFRDLWHAAAVMDHMPLTKTFVVPGVGPVDFAMSNSPLGGDPDLRLLIFSPMDAAAEAFVDAGSPGRAHQAG